jgi:hypothetical protein
MSNRSFARKFPCPRICTVRRCTRFRRAARIRVRAAHPSRDANQSGNLGTEANHTTSTRTPVYPARRPAEANCSRAGRVVLEARQGTSQGAHEKSAPRSAHQQGRPRSPVTRQGGFTRFPRASEAPFQHDRRGAAPKRIRGSGRDGSCRCGGSALVGIEPAGVRAEEAARVSGK